MFLIWTGWGILTPIIAAIPFLVINLVLDGAFGNQYYVLHAWPKGLAVAVSALSVWYAGRAINSKPGRVMVDKATGEEVVLKSTHTLFFIRMEYWAVAILALGVAVCLSKG